MDPKRILLIRLDRIGDVVLSTPAIKALRDKFPDSYIAFMVGPHAYELVKENPYLNEVIVYDKNSSERSFIASFKFARKLREKKFDTAIALHPTLRSHLIPFIAGIPRRIGYDRKGESFLTERVIHQKEQGEFHEAEYVLKMLEVLGVKSSDKTLYLKVSEDSLKKMREKLLTMGVGASEKIVAIHPGASSLSKKWPIERFAEIARYLVKNFNIKIALVAGKVDAEYTKKIYKYLKSDPSYIINLAGKTTIGELAAVLKISSLFISNDSGPVHISVAVGTPVISIFGRSDKGLGPKRWGPLGKDDVVIHKNVGCNVCLAHNCVENFKCLNAVEPEDIIEAVLKFKERLS